MKKFFLAVAGMMAGVAFGATEAIDGMTYEYTIECGNATITKATGDNKNVVIPSKLGGATVTRLWGGTFMNNTTMMKVTIPETVTSMTSAYEDFGTVAPFRGCIALTSCTIPSGVTAIPGYCFYGCTKLRAVTLPKGLRSIGYEAFYQCSSLSAIDLPEGLTSIDGYAFYSCSSLTRVIIPDSVTSIGSFCFYYSSLVSAHLPTGLTSIPDGLFYFCGSLKEVNVPAGVTSIGVCAFWCCHSLKEIALPAGVTSVGDSAFGGVGRAIFLGKPPAGLPNASISQVVYPKEYGALWQAYFPIAQTGGLVNPNKPVVTIVSSDVRKNNPTVLDVVYKVTSTKPTVKVRALAFEDGERSFAKVTRPETFIEGTAANIGDAITVNVEHTLSWQVSTDFKTDLAKMKFEVLAVEDDVLPLELMTIPANGSNKAMELSWNMITESQVFDALLWLYADKTEGLMLSGGVLKNGEAIVAENAAVKTLNKAKNTWAPDSSGLTYSQQWQNASEYIFSQMGYSAMSGSVLLYANEMTRMGLSPSGIRQYAYRWIDK